MYVNAYRLYFARNPLTRLVSQFESGFVILSSKLASLNHFRLEECTLTQAQMPIRAAPYAHQQAAYEFCTRLFTEDASPGAALLMEMGTGKTLTTIAIAGAL